MCERLEGKVKCELGRKGSESNTLLGRSEKRGSPRTKEGRKGGKDAEEGTEKGNGATLVRKDRREMGVREGDQEKQEKGKQKEKRREFNQGEERRR